MHSFTQHLSIDFSKDYLGKDDGYVFVTFFIFNHFTIFSPFEPCEDECVRFRNGELVPEMLKTFHTIHPRRKE